MYRLPATASECPPAQLRAGEGGSCWWREPGHVGGDGEVDVEAKVLGVGLPGWKRGWGIAIAAARAVIGRGGLRRR